MLENAGKRLECYLKSARNTEKAGPKSVWLTNAAQNNILEVQMSFMSLTLTRLTIFSISIHVWANPPPQMLLIFQSHGWAGVLNGWGSCFSSGGWGGAVTIPPVATGQPGHSGHLTSGSSLQTNLYILGLYIKTRCRVNPEHELWKWFEKRGACYRSTVSLQTQVTWPKEEKWPHIFC